MSETSETQDGRKRPRTPAQVAALLKARAARATKRLQDGGKAKDTPLPLKVRLSPEAEAERLAQEIASALGTEPGQGVIETQTRAAWTRLELALSPEQRHALKADFPILLLPEHGSPPACTPVTVEARPLEARPLTSGPPPAPTPVTCAMAGCNQPAPYVRRPDADPAVPARLCRAHHKDYLVKQAAEPVRTYLEHPTRENWLKVCERQDWLGEYYAIRDHGLTPAQIEKRETGLPKPLASYSWRERKEIIKWLRAQDEEYYRLEGQRTWWRRPPEPFKPPY